MPQEQDASMQNIRQYLKDAHELHDDSMELDVSDTEARLAQTVKELRARVEEQETALQRVRSFTCTFYNRLLLKPE